MMKETLTERARFTARGRHLFGGAVHIFASEALLVPVGLLTAAYLSRRFGPEGYGLLTLAFAPVVLLESNVATALSRPPAPLLAPPAPILPTAALPEARPAVLAAPVRLSGW